MYKSSTLQLNGNTVTDVHLSDNQTSFPVNIERAKFDNEIQMHALRKSNKSDFDVKYENQYKKDMQGLNIDRRSMETSMLAYTERMREITLQRSTQAMQPLMVKQNDSRRWASLSALNNRGNNNRDLSLKMPPASIPERSMSADESQTPFMVPEKDSLPERPFSDTHNRGVFQFYEDNQNRLRQEGQYNDRIRARAHQRREMGFNSLRKNMDKFAELKTHYELHEDAYMPQTDDHKNVSIEIFPFPAIELQAVPAVLHRNPKAEKQKKRKKKRESSAEKRSYVFRPEVKTRMRASAKSKIKNKRRNERKSSTDSSSAKDKTKKNVDFSYSEAVNLALRNAVGDFEGDLDSVLKSHVINVPEIKEEIKRLQAEAKKKAEQAKAAKAKKMANAVETSSKSPHERKRGVNIKTGASKSHEGSTDHEGLQETLTLKSVLKKDNDVDSNVKPVRKSVQFQEMELIRMITKLSEIHRRSPDETESNDETAESESSDNESDDFNSDFNKESSEALASTHSTSEDSDGDN